jgi:hypothetical protein
MNDDVDKKLNELRDEESTGNRLDRDDPQSQPHFVDVLEEALESIDQGESSNTITAYDPNSLLFCKRWRSMTDGRRV